MHFLFYDRLAEVDSRVDIHIALVGEIYEVLELVDGTYCTSRGNIWGVGTGWWSLGTMLVDVINASQNFKFANALAGLWMSLVLDQIMIVLMQHFFHCS